MVSKDTVRRFGTERCQSRIEAEPGRAVGTQDRVRLAHIDVDVRVVLRWGHADALEFPHPDADFGDVAVVPELQIAARRLQKTGTSVSITSRRWRRRSLHLPHHFPPSIIQPRYGFIFHAQAAQEAGFHA